MAGRMLEGLLNVSKHPVKLESAQVTLLDDVCAGPLLSAAALREAGAIPVPAAGV